MPPFYIGSSSIEKVNNGYCGSVESMKYGKIWNKEIKDNPHLFESKIISVHNTRQEALDKEYKLQKQLNVVKESLYINQSLAGKGGCVGMDASGVLNPMYGKTWPDESKLKFSKKLIESGVNRGSNNSMYGIARPDLSARNKIIKPNQHGSNNHAFGKVWICNEHHSMFATKEVLKEYLNNGYKLGRKFN